MIRAPRTRGPVRPAPAALGARDQARGGLRTAASAGTRAAASPVWKRRPLCCALASSGWSPSSPWAMHIKASRLV